MVRVMSTRTPGFSSRDAFQLPVPSQYHCKVLLLQVGLCSCSWIKLQMGLVFTVTKSLWMAAPSSSTATIPPNLVSSASTQHTFSLTQDKSLQYPSYSPTSLYDTLSISFWIHPSKQSFLYHLVLQQSVMSKSGYKNIVGDRAENLAEVQED